jgi:phosphoribosylformimino-5-aminoimidazole carboxamide ribonucleotide (ProFAR) isomerase
MIEQLVTHQVNKVILQNKAVEEANLLKKQEQQFEKLLVSINTQSNTIIDSDNG